MSNESENNPARRVEDKRADRAVDLSDAPRFNALGIAETWSVTVDAEGRRVLCISEMHADGLDGELGQFKATVRNCAMHLLGFIGSGPIQASPASDSVAVDLDDLQALHDAATSAPWEWWTSNSTLRLTGGDGRDGGVLHGYVHAGCGDVSCSVADRALIVEMRNALPALIALARSNSPAASCDNEPVELAGVREEIAEGSGFWRECSGCYDTEDGHPTQSYGYSKVFGCSLGNGCSECGGIGAVWDNSDYDAMACDLEHEGAASCEKEQAAIPPVIREAIEATFEQRPGYMTKAAAAVRALGAAPSSDDVRNAALEEAVAICRDNVSQCCWTAEHIGEAILDLKSDPAAAQSVGDAGGEA